MASDRRAEPDVAEDPQEVTTRAPDGAYVGRVAKDDEGAPGETGAERRAQHEGAPQDG